PPRSVHDFAAVRRPARGENYRAMSQDAPSLSAGKWDDIYSQERSATEPAGKSNRTAIRRDRVEAVAESGHGKCQLPFSAAEAIEHEQPKWLGSVGPVRHHQALSVRSPGCVASLGVQHFFFNSPRGGNRVYLTVISRVSHERDDLAVWRPCR